MVLDNPSPRHKTGLYLRGRWLVLARVAWIALVALILAMFVASFQAFHAMLQSGCTTAACHAFLASFTVKSVTAAGFSVNFYVTYIYAITILFLLAFLAIGAVLFWFRSYDFMALYTSFSLVAFTMAFNSNTILVLAPAWWLPAQIIAFLGNVLFGIFPYVFPNGRFVPRWTGWLILPLLVYSVASYLFPNSPFANFWLINSLFPCLLVTGVGAQVYRYWRISSQVERQQTKWVVFGTSVGVVGALLIIGVFFNNGSPDARSALIAGTALYIFILLIPLSIAFAILRSRLWDIDVIINKALVYGLLSVLLAATYAGLVLGLQAILGGLFHQTSAIALVISTLVIATLFQPLRRRIQRLIDRRFYRSKYNAAHTLAQFSATLRNEVDLSQLSERLIMVVEETMQPAHVSLWLRKPERGRERNISV